MANQASAQPGKRPYRLTSGYLVAIGLIYLATACAWLILGKITDTRTQERDEGLRSEVGRLWGGTHNHLPPTVVVPAETVPVPAAAPAPRPAAGAAAVAATTAAPAKAPPPGSGPRVADAAAETPNPCRLFTTLEAIASDARARLALEHRRKGLLWYSTYTIHFDGSYRVANTTACAREARLWVPFPASGVAYDEFQVLLDGRELAVQIEGATSREGAQPQSSGASARIAIAPGAARTVTVRYKSRGMDRWSYSFGAHTARARNFKLAVITDFDKVDFPGGSLSPTHKRRTADGWELAWQFGNLLSDAGIAVAMPQRINPGPLAAQISKFAPVSLAFFFFLLLLLSVLKQVPLHPVHYGMLAAAFFSFHLLLVYSVDLMPLWLAFALSSLVSVGLVVSYLRLAVSAGFAFGWAGGAQLLYLVLFSLAFFLEGYTGITITIFSILTLAALMQLTGRIDWSARFGRAPVAPPPDAGAPGANEAPRVFSRVA
jgi:hypothetical protein